MQTFRGTDSHTVSGEKKKKTWQLLSRFPEELKVNISLKKKRIQKQNPGKYSLI